MAPTSRRTPFVSVVIPARDAAGTIGRCLDALAAQQYPADRYEVLVVDNGSRDATAEIVSGKPRATLLTETKPGAYAARNRGVAAARGEIVAFTDADCMPAPDWLATAVAAIGDGASIVLGRRRAYRPSRALRLLDAYEAAKEAFVFNSGDPMLAYGYTANMAVSMEELQRQGGFAELMRGADTEFVQAHVAHAAAMGVPHGRTLRYSSEMEIVHLEMRGIAMYYRKCFLYGRHRRRRMTGRYCRPLSRAERMVVLRATIREAGLGSVGRIGLMAVLGPGLTAWYAGRLSRSFSPIARSTP
ncbi:MAG: glycosyltransferase [Pseudomonadota bacterium]